MRPVCQDCNLEMNCKKNDVLVKIENMMPRRGDLYECPQCFARIVTGFGTPIEEPDEGENHE